MQAMETKASPYFTPISMQGVYNRNIAQLTPQDCTETVVANRQHLLTGSQILCGIPFELGDSGDENNVLLLRDCPVTCAFPEPLHDRFLVFLHAVDFRSNHAGADGIVPNYMGTPRLGETVADYVLQYEDGTEQPVAIRRRFGIGEFMHGWGTDSFECIPHTKPQSFRTNTEELVRGKKPGTVWGASLFRSAPGGSDCPMQHWLYAVENPYTEKGLVSVALQPKAGNTVFVFGMVASALQSNPIRWDASKRLKLTLPEDRRLNTFGDFDELDIDLGTIVAAYPVLEYDDGGWETGYVNNPPAISGKTVMVEYTAHPQAILHFGDGKHMPTAALRGETCIVEGHGLIQAAKPDIPVKIRVIDSATGMPVSAKLHIHSTDGEYLAPMNRHRFPNPFWFEDYSVDYVNDGHCATYIDGETTVKLPQGEVFLEVTKGFEIKPIRRRYLINRDTRDILIELEYILPWRTRGWVSADTHVHFLSPHSALLEGSGEGVNVVNLLASQWGELFTNIGDFDGATTLGSKETGGSGEYLVRVGTENRQHILGHISLLGYEGSMILPLTTGGTDESRLGDPVENSLMDWAAQCRQQNGLAILPHFPNPRAEGAAALVMNLIDGVEMTSWGAIFSGINPYSLSDWYRYLNCGFFVPAVGGTDKMSADTPVGAVRTYALINDGPLTYESWKEAVRRGRTFATYGPLLEFHIDGQEMGDTIMLPQEGGMLDIHWEVSSVTIPVTKVELVINGELREMKQLDDQKQEHSGSWPIKASESGWAALRVRGRYPDREEVIAAHSSPVILRVGEKPIFSKPDAMTILDQIEGACAYVKNLGSKAEEQAYKQLMLNLTAAHRKLHNAMHQQGVYHNHTAVDDHHNS